MVMNNPANNNPLAASLAIAPSLHPSQPHRPSTSCDIHPDECFTGFCPSCLFQRLSVIDITGNNNSVASSSSKKPPLSSTALKSTFNPSTSSSSTSQNWIIPGLLFPELRRTKSFSATKNEAFSLGAAFEPQRRSCDVRVRNTLWSLFNEDVEHNSQTKEGLSEIDLERINSTVKSPIFEEETEIECEKDINCGKFKEPRSVIDEIVEEEEEEEIEEEETAKVEEQMEFNPQTTKKPNRTGSFWSAASVFSKKLQKWRQKQKLKKHRTGNLGAGSAMLPVEKLIGRQLRDTQSEIAEYGYGRRSCDTDPRFSIDAGRFSLDAGRVSVDDPRYSFDEPRASWDGYLRTAAAPPRMQSMLSVVEDSPIRNHVFLSDTHISVEKPPPSPSSPQRPVTDEIVVPGGSVQTREYYLDSSSRRRKSLDRSSSTRKSLDRSSSTRKISAAVVAEINASNANGSIIHPHSHSNSLRDDCSVENNFEMGVRDNNAGTMDCNKKGITKKSKRWSWNIFGLLHRKKENKYEKEEKNNVDQIFSGLWNVETRKRFDPKMMRSNSSVSWRSSGTTGGGFPRNSVDGYVDEKKKKVSKIENGMLKFNSKPSTGRRRGSNSMGDTNWPVPASQPFEVKAITCEISEILKLNQNSEATRGQKKERVTEIWNMLRRHEIDKIEMLRRQKNQWKQDESKII